MTSEIKSYIQRLADQSGGIITPEILVADAKRKDSPLHSLFEWDAKKAAEAHWLATARDILRRVKITVSEGERLIVAPCYVRHPDLPAKVQGYIDTGQLDPDQARETLRTIARVIAAQVIRGQGIAARAGLPQSDLEAVLGEIGIGLLADVREVR